MTSFYRCAAACGVAIWLAAQPAAAQDSLGTVAAQAQQAISEGRTADALDLAEQFERMVWEEAPLGFRNTMLVDEEPAAFGKAVARASDAYGVDEEIHIYAEPLAFGWRQTDGGWETDLVGDVRVADTDGRIIAAHKGFSEFKFTSADRSEDAFLTLTYVFGGLGPGSYEVTTTLHDRVTGKSGAFSIPITIR